MSESDYRAKIMLQTADFATVPNVRAFIESGIIGRRGQPSPRRGVLRGQFKMTGNLADLQSRAKAVLAEVVQNPPDRPKFVEFSGTPKSGKSTCIDSVSHFFRRIRLDDQNPENTQAKFTILAPTEGASRRTPAFLRDDLVAFNAWSASYALTHILEGRHHSDRFHLAILDRGLFDALAWFQVLEMQGDISTADMEKVHDFLLVDHWRSEVDTVFLFTADAETSLSRENEGKLIDAPGRAMNTEFIYLLNEAYAKTRERFEGEFKSVIPIDTSENVQSTPLSTSITVADHILELFRTNS